MRPVDSLSSGSEKTETTSSRSPVLLKWAQAISLACAGLMAEAGHAQDQPATAEAIDIQSTNPIARLAATRHRAYPLLDNPDSLVRHQAYTDARTAAIKALNYKCPLPEHFIRWKQAGSAQQRAAIRQHNNIIMERMKYAPARIVNDTNAHVHIRPLLEAHLGLRISYPNDDKSYAEEPLLAPGQSVSCGEALEAICFETRTVPSLSAEGIKLSPASPNQSMCFDGRFYWVKTEHAESMPEYKVFGLDQHQILNMEPKAPFKSGFVKSSDALIPQYTQKIVANVTTEANDIPWTASSGQGTPKPLKSHGTDFDKTRLSYASHPETKTMLVKEKENLEIGPQQLWIDAIEQKDGKWIIKCGGTIFQHVPWPDTSVQQDTPLYQFAATNRMIVTNKKKEVIQHSIGEMTVKLRTYTYVITTVEEPSEITATMFRSYSNELVAIPKDQDMEKISHYK